MTCQTESFTTGRVSTLSRLSQFDPMPEEIRRTFDRLAGMFPKPQDRRVVPRWGYVAPAILSDGTGQVAEFWTKDINTFNAGFLSNAPIPVGTTGAFRLELPNGRRFETKARVMRCQEFAPGCYIGHVNFSDTLGEELAELTRRPNGALPPD